MVTTCAGVSLALLIFLAAVVIVMLVAWGNKWLAGWLDQKLAPVRRRFRLSPQRFSLYFNIQAWFGYLLGISLLLYLLSRLPDTRAPWLDEHFTATHIAASLLSILLVALLFATVWETANFAMEYGASKSHLSRARLDTLLPVVRNVLLVTLFMTGQVLIADGGLVPH